MKFFLFIILALLISTPAFSANRYFAENAFSTKKNLNDILSNHLTKHLKAMNELPLYNRFFWERSNIYRFLWLRTFDRPICIKLHIHSNGTSTLYIKMTDGFGGHEPGKIIVNKNKYLSVSETSEFITKVNQANFWEMPSVDCSSIGLDGSSWLLEATQKGQYHLVERWTPEKGTFRELGLYLIQLSGITGENLY